MALNEQLDYKDRRRKKKLTQRKGETKCARGWECCENNDGDKYEK